MFTVPSVKPPLTREFIFWGVDAWGFSKGDVSASGALRNSLECVDGVASRFVSEPRRSRQTDDRAAFQTNISKLDIRLLHQE